jgi:hypothetical protein
MATISSLAGFSTATIIILIFQTDVVKNFHKWDVIWAINMTAFATIVGLLTFFVVRNLTKRDGK